LGAATALPAAAILTIVGETTARLIPARADAAEWVEMLQIDSLRPMAWREIDSSMAASSGSRSAGSRSSASRSSASRSSDAALADMDARRLFVAQFMNPDQPAESAWIVNPVDVPRLPPENSPANANLDDLARHLRDAPSAA